MSDNREVQAPTLERALGLSGVVIIGIAWVTPLIVLATIGIIAQLSNGAAPSAYLVTLVAMLFTAYSYGRMASVHYLTAGSAYTYVGREIGPRLGFLTGWLILLDYFFIPLVVWLIGAAYLSAQFPGVSMAVWIIAFILVTTALNIIGIKVNARANCLLVAFQLRVLGTYGVVAQLSNGTVPTAYLVTLVAMLFTALSYGRMASLYPVAGSAYTYVGKEMGPQLGFLSGWLIQLDYFFLPMVAWLIGAAYLSAQFPGVPTPVWILAFILITTILNVVGIKTAARQPERDRALLAPPAAARRLGATRVGRPPRGGRAHRLLPAYEARHPRRSVRGGVAGDRGPAADLPHQGLPPGPAPAEHR